MFGHENLMQIELFSYLERMMLVDQLVHLVDLLEGNLGNQVVVLGIQAVVLGSQAVVLGSQAVPGDNLDMVVVVDDLYNK